MVSMIFAAIAAGAVAGLASAPHCAAMCGPIAAFACGRATPTASGFRSWARPVRYQTGRALGYGVLGVAVGGTGGWITGWLEAPVGAAMLSWSLAVGLGLAALRLWRARPGPEPGLVSLGRARRTDLRTPPHLHTPPRVHTQSRLRTRRGGITTVLARLPSEPLVLGTLTALLPCGALASALLLATGSGSMLGGAVTMLAFVTTTSIGLLLAGWLGGRMPRGGASARVLATGLAVGAVLLVLRPLPALRHAPQACHGSVELSALDPAPTQPHPARGTTSAVRRGPIAAR